MDRPGSLVFNTGPGSIHSGHVVDLAATAQYLVYRCQFSFCSGWSYTMRTDKSLLSHYQLDVLSRVIAAAFGGYAPEPGIVVCHDDQLLLLSRGNHLGICSTNGHQSMDWITGDSATLAGH